MEIETVNTANKGSINHHPVAGPSGLRSHLPHQRRPPQQPLRAGPSGSKTFMCCCETCKKRFSDAHRFQGHGHWHDSQDLVKTMKEDKLNSKIWKEVQETPFKTRKELVEKVETEFSCVEMQYPENYQETQAKKLAEKASKLSDKENQGDEKSKGKKRKNSEEIEPLSFLPLHSLLP